MVDDSLKSLQIGGCRLGKGADPSSGGLERLLRSRCHPLELRGIAPQDGGDNPGLTPSSRRCCEGGATLAGAHRLIRESDTAAKTAQRLTSTLRRFD